MTAPIINIAIEIAAGPTNSLFQYPANNAIARAILVAPTTYTDQSGNP